MTGRRRNPLALLGLVAALHLAACALHCRWQARSAPMERAAPHGQQHQQQQGQQQVDGAQGRDAAAGAPQSLYAMSLWDVLGTDPGTLLWRAVSEELGGASSTGEAQTGLPSRRGLEGPPVGGEESEEEKDKGTAGAGDAASQGEQDGHASARSGQFKAVHVAHMHLIGLAVFAGAWLPCLYLRLGIYTRRAVWQCVAGAVLCFTASACCCLAVFSMLSGGVALCLSLQSVAHHLAAVWATCSFAPDYPLVAGTVPPPASFAGYKLAAQLRGSPGGLPKAAIATGALLLGLYVQGGWGGDDLLAGWGLENPTLASPGGLRDKGVVALLTHHAAAAVLLEVVKGVVYRLVLWAVLWGA